MNNIPKDYLMDLITNNMNKSIPQIYKINKELNNIYKSLERINSYINIINEQVLPIKPFDVNAPTELDESFTPTETIIESCSIKH